MRGDMSATTAQSKKIIIIFTRGSNIDTKFWYSGIELNTKFRYWKWENSGILEAENGHWFWCLAGAISAK